MRRGIFGSVFDFDRDGKMSAMERAAEFYFIHNVLLTEERDKALEDAGLDKDELGQMDEGERREMLENAGLDPCDFEDDF